MTIMFTDPIGNLTPILTEIDDRYDTTLSTLDDDSKRRIISRYTTDTLPGWLDDHGFDSTVYAMNVHRMEWWLDEQGYDDTRLIMETVQDLADEHDPVISARLNGIDLYEKL